MPIDDQELLNLFRDFVTERVERKAVFKPLKPKICETICAFANDLHNRHQAGVIFIGVQDDGTCEGKPIEDSTLREIADIRGEGKILPFPIISVEKMVFDGCEVAAIIVEPSAPPQYGMMGKYLFGLAQQLERQHLKRSANLEPSGPIKCTRSNLS